ncbi:penicillin acylase family protein [candidate division KSB1 bacterium]|nr:penicillin acylase family protein [candidate division KSB1 bacterium]
MSNTGKIIRGILIVSILTFLSIIFFSHLLINRSIPKYSGSYRCHMIGSNVSIYRDDYGVPHIIANDEKDLFFSAGFVHAQDRLWQLNLLKHMANGTLSEIFGEETRSLDRFVRLAGLSRLTEKILADLSPESTTMLTHYVNGINACIDIRSANLPIEFITNDHSPSHWTIDDIITVHRFVVLCNSLFHNDDLLRSAIAYKAPARHLRELNLTKSYIPGRHSSIDANDVLRLHHYLQSVRSQINSLLPIEFNFFSWFLPAEQSDTKHPILAQTIDVVPSSTTLFYEIHLICPNINYQGFTIPGIPLFFEGNNNDFSWSANTLLLDEIHFFIESTNSNSYRSGSTRHPLELDQELIDVRNQPSDTLTIRRTPHGPIISDLVESFVDQRFSVSYQWVGSITTDEFLGAYQLIHSKNSRQFLASVQHHKFPALEFIYADANNMIGRTIAAVPPKQPLAQRMYLWDGTSTQFEKYKFADPVELPSSFSSEISTPSPAALLSHSLNHASRRNHHLLLHHRYQRVQQLIEAKTSLKLPDIIAMQNDSYSNFNEMVTRSIIDDILTSSIDERFKLYFHDILHHYDYRAERVDIATSICHVMSHTLLRSIFRDELGDTLYRAVAANPYVSTDLLYQILQNPTSVWYDDVDTRLVEKRSDIVKSSLAEAFLYLKNHYGELVDDWRWGKLTTLYFSDNPYTDSLKNSLLKEKSIALRGYGDAIFSAVTDYTPEVHISLFSGLLRIAETSNRDYTRSLTYAGQSDQIISEHYADQFSLWENSSLKKCLLNREKIEEKSVKLLVLKPN